ncbi:MAG: hypothetical protein ACOZE5_11845 [Verrucomicrobiota bacterium]
MAIETKPTERPARGAKPPPLEFTDNPEKQKMIEDYRAAHPTKEDYYLRLVKENPERAVRAFLLKDAEYYKLRTSYLTNQLPSARAFYDAQTPEARARIDRQLVNSKPFYRDADFVEAVLRESGRQGLRATATQGPGGPSMSLSGPDAGKVVPMPNPPGTATPPKMATG